MSRTRGFSLIDLLIGMTIGLFGAIAVGKVLVDFNQRRNTSVRLMESQNNGAMALYLIQKDLAQAGYGLMPLQNCAEIQYYYAGNAGLLTTFPLQIVDGGANSDAVIVQYASSNSGSPSAILTTTQASFDVPYGVGSIAGFKNGDLIVINSSNQCTMSQVSSLDNSTNPPQIAHVFECTTSGLASCPYNPNGVAAAWYSDAAHSSAASTTNLVGSQGDQIINLGLFVRKAYSVTVTGTDALTGTLAVSDFPAVGASSPLVDNVVFMKAQYGIDTDEDGAVNSWRNASAGGFTVTNGNARQVIAIRIGVVVLSPQLEKDAVAQTASVTVLPDTTGGTDDNSVAFNIPDSHFRYRVYNTVIPLRNVIWGR